MLQLENEIALATSMAVFPNEQGLDTLYVVTKAALTLDLARGGAPTLADEPPTVVLADEFWGAPETSSLRRAAELHVGKAGTDVILVGQAHAPGERPVPESLVSVSVAERKKVVRVFGERIWKSGGISAPQPFTSMPLVFERAFGGTYVDLAEEGRVHAEERNPVGRGFLGPQRPAALLGAPLPNLEDPRQPLTRPGDAQAPACFSFVAASWLPRRRHAGTYDENWQKQRAPYLPEDFALAFFNGAAPELTFDRFLLGGEPVEVLGASREGPLRFQVPTWSPALAINVAGVTESPPLRLETILIEPDEHRVSLTWRASLPCDRKVHEIRQVSVKGLPSVGAGRPRAP